LLEWTPAVYTLLVLAIAGALDVRSREIPPWYWLVAVAVGLPITVAVYRGDLGVLIAYQVLSLVVVIPSYIMYRYCMLGGADVLAFLVIAILSPVRPGSIIPLLYLAVLYAVAPAIAYHLYSAWIACNGFKVGCMSRMKFKVKVRTIVEDPRFKWWLVDVKGECSVEGDPRALALKAGQGDLDAYIDATPGHPYVAHLAIGYLVAIAIGDKPILELVTALAKLV
jgi:Flp pilus assembly protein protease CpaA